jgi:AraC family transcriptional regulator, regulatory protein of adaptative response / methylated-DNA-[protein]-cysteine methyltransferase
MSLSDAPLMSPRPTNAAPRSLPRPAPASADARWAALRARDPNADGSFFYSVSTTGVYCRPSCGARPARPENVAFHASAAEAERAGFRACKRCKPDQPALAERRAELVADLCRYIDAAEAPVGLKALAERAGLSTFHTQRSFKAVMGLTPKAYAAAARAARMRAELERAPSITRAIYGAGYNSSARFYEHSNAVLGMTPSQYRAGGKDQRIAFALGRCALGSILVAASERGVCAILLGSDTEALVAELAARFPRAERVARDADFERLLEQVVTLVEQPARACRLPLDLRGTAFQERVWQALTKIPPGTTASYSDIARAIGAPSASRAVARACAANTLAVAIPCHRVVRSDGSLSGYRWGVERKRALLEREAESASEAQGSSAARSSRRRHPRQS